MRRSYLDHAATSPMTEAVRNAYLEALEFVGNPASTHAHGQQSSMYLENARSEVATWLGAESVEVTFTSGGTESINLALKGMYWERQKSASRPYILISQAEHHATLDAAEWLERHEQAKLVWIPVDATGAVQASAVEAALHDVDPAQVALITVMWANNEVGTVSPIREITRVAAPFDIPVHVDAVAALGQVPVSLADSGATLMSVSAHKVGGPVGVGALAISRQAKLEALMHGGAQQRARSGTQNVAGAVAFAAALREMEPLTTHAQKLRTSRDRIIEGVRQLVPEAMLRGADPHTAHRLPGNAHFTFPGCQGDSLLFLLDMQGVSVSVGSACQAGVQEISHVLLAMGLSEDEAIGSLRLTVSAETTTEDIDAFLTALPVAYRDARTAGFVSP